MTGLNPQARRKRIVRSVNMGVAVESAVYEPPPLDECQVEEYPVDLDPSARLVCRQRIHHGKIVDFSIQQEEFSWGEWHPVARIDSNGGTVHRHQYRRSTGDQDALGHQKIVDIPIDGGYDVVNRMFWEAYATMCDEWEANRGRWRS